MDYFKDFVVNMPGDYVERTLGMGTQHVNDRSQSNGSSKKLQNILVRLPSAMMMMLMVTLIFLFMLLAKLRRELNSLLTIVVIIL